MLDTRTSILAPEKFADLDHTADGKIRASVDFRQLKTLWFNTGTLCNITCINCYIESSPKNDRLVYLTEADVLPFLDEVDALGDDAIEIGFTGGEPFMNPAMLALARRSLERGHRVLILTNAMQPMQRPRVKAGLSELAARFGDQLVLRVSLDHHTAEKHDEERGPGSFEKTLEGLRWLADEGIRLDVAGRTCWGEAEADERAGYAALFERLGLDVPADDPARLVLFPEMEAEGDPPEITTECWGILDLDPATIMCASSRMVVRRRGAAAPAVLSCTLLPYDDAFELADTLEASLRPVKLKHRFCAQFCVLGGASCS